VLALGAPGCGGGGRPDATKTLRAAASKLGTIRSGKLALRLLVEPRGPGGEFGFGLAGPFALPKAAGALPVARLVYTQIAGGRRGSATFISTGRRAFVSVGGTAYRLPPAQARQLRGGTSALGRTGGLKALRIDRWIEEPKASDGGRMGGVATDHVHARLDVVNAVNDLLGIARELGSSRAQRLTGRDAERLRRATRSGNFDLYAGKDDHLLRRLTVAVDLGFDVPKVLRAALGRVVGAKVLFDLRVTNPNRPVTVSAPAGARPYSALPKR
jgi:hypothetical protein